MTRKQSARALGLAALLVIPLLFVPSSDAQREGPVIVPRDPTSPSIHEGSSGIQNPGFRKDVEPFLGLLPASYDWFGGILRAIGSAIQPFAADPTYLGYKSGQQVGYDVFRLIGFKRAATRLYEDFKKIGGKNVTDIARLGTPGGKSPGDPYWVGYPRPGNVEFPPALQTGRHFFDCFCRADEEIDCPIPDHPDWHVNWGGWARYRVNCVQCFGIERIRKHDYYVGTNHGSFPGYRRGDPADPGYQECLRQSVESFAASGPGGPVQGEPELYGL